MSGVPVPGSQSPLDAVWSALQLATERYNFYENIVQIRLQSFVLADSVLILGWVTLYASASPGQSYRDVALVAGSLKHRVQRNVDKSWISPEQLSSSANGYRSPSGIDGP